MGETLKRPLRVFLCHASQDKPVVRKLFCRLENEGWIDVWLDEKKLLPGQDWQLEIEEAVEASDTVIICLSSNSVNKEGFVQKELRYAKEIALEKPKGTIFLIPLRLDDCNVPSDLRSYQWSDYFGEKIDETYNKLLEALKRRYKQILELERERRARQEVEEQKRATVEGMTHEQAERETEERTYQETDRQEREASEKILNFEDDIDRKLAREERTALFINLTGVHTQQALAVVDKGIASRKLEKILANVLIDWHWLSFKYPTRFKFYGAGELHWVPVRGGATALVVPGIDYADMKFHQGYFANLIDLFDESFEYRKYGFRGMIGNRHLLFPPFIPLIPLEKSPIEFNERYFWEPLIKTYALLDDQALNALASCRNDATSVLCLWTQFIFWKRYTGTAVEVLRWHAVEALDDLKRQRLVEKFRDAGQCIRHLSLLIGYKSKIQKYINQVQEVAKNTELASYIPVTDILPETSLADKYETFVELSALLKDLNDICRSFQIHMGLAEPGATISYTALQAGLENIKMRLSISGEIVDFPIWHWHSLFRQGDSKREAARLLLALIEAVFAAFQRKLGLPFGQLRDHYQTFLERFYPLPTKHFFPGN